LRVVCVIPARYDSRRLPGKPLLKIRGKTLIQWVFENAQKIPACENIWVATDDERVAECVERFSGNVILTSSAISSGTDRVREASAKLGLKEDDIVINLQGDEPIIDVSSVERLVAEFLEHSSLLMGTLAFRSENKEEFYNPNVVKVVIDKKGFALYFSRSPIPYPRDTDGINFLKHLGIYIFRYSFLKRWDSFSPSRLEETEKLEQLRVLENGYPIKVLLSDRDSCGVDTPEDLQFMEENIEKFQR